ncbi:MAG TPA: hypothetical protein VLD66_04960 [Methyloceanibacter sp.]|nr:hypothetical protein [Methyloceanibacter sp.]
MKMLLAIAGFVLSVALIAEAGFALPRASSIERSPAVELVGFGCNFVNGKLICGKSESGDDADDADDDSGDHPKKKKAKDTGDELTECTIQQGPGGGGCVTGFKHVCQKMKNGKKCCGCVPDKNAQAPAGGAGPAPKVVRICCDANFSGPGSGPVICSTDNTPPSTEAQMRATFEKLYPGKVTTCAPECLSPNGATAAKYCH